MPKIAPRRRSALGFTAQIVVAAAFVLLGTTIAEARPYRLMWDANTDAITTGYLVYVGTAAGSYGIVNGTDVGNVLEFQTNLTPGTTYYFAVRAYDSNHSPGPFSDEFVFTVPNIAPVLTNPGLVASAPGDSVSLQLSATDGDGDSLTFPSVTGLPPGLSASAAGLISGTITAGGAGTYSVTARASDGGAQDVETFTWRVISFTASSPVQSGGTITGTVAHGPGGVGDWVALASSGAPLGSYLTRRYLNNLSTPPSAGLVTAAVTFTAPAPGAYELRFFRNDSLTLFATRTVTVSAASVQSVTVSSDLSPPQGVGTAITFTATPTGGTAPYQYKWVTYDGSSWTFAGGWTSSSTFVWTPTMSGTYAVGVWVRSQGATADVAEAVMSIPFAVVASLRVTAATLTPDRASPQPIGTTVNWTAGQTGGIAPFQYKWFVSDGTTWTQATGWTSAATFAWTAPTAQPNASVRVWVRSAGNSVDAAEASATVPYVIVSSTRVTAVTLTPNRASPQPAGTSITFTAVPTGGIAPYQYKWLVYNGVSWTVQGTWTTSNTFAWTPAAAGSYSVGVWVKSAGNPADAAEFPQSMAYVVSASAPVSSVGLASNLAAPQLAGTTVTWTATPTGGTSPYQYQWWVYNGASWSALTGWVASNTFAWTPTSPNLAYQIRVWVRSSGNTVDAAEAASASPFAITAPPVSAVALSANRVSPQPAGTSITFTAAPTGGVAPYQYKWWVFNGAAWTIAADWTTASSFAWTPLTANANYSVRVWARSAGNSADAAEASATTPFVISTPTTVSNVALSANRVSPQPAGTSITFTAVPTGGVAPHQYKWWIFDGVAWTVQGTWTTSNTFAWTPAAAGSYSVGVWVKSAGNPADAAELPQSMAYVVSASAPVSSVGLASNLAAPQLAGTTVTWTATPTGGTAPYQYQWWMYNGASWSALTGWVASNTYAWTPTSPNLAYQIRVWVRSSGNTVDAAEAASASPFAITAPPVSAVALSANRVSPQPAGTSITFTAAPTGGVAPYQYKWWVFNGAAWTIAADWTTASSFAWTPLTANANYSVRVWARSAGNSADAAEASATTPFVISTPTTVSNVALSANRVSPQPAGTSITFTAVPTGGVAPHQYKWLIFDGVTWTVQGTWTTSSTFAWTPGAAGSYFVGVWVKSAGNPADAAEFPQSMAYVVSASAPPPPPPSTSVSSVSLTSNLAAPQLAGTTVTWTAIPTGGVGPHQYKWWVFDGVAWAVQGTWTTSNTFVWTPAVPGNYSVGVWVKSAGNPADAAELPVSVPFVVP